MDQCQHASLIIDKPRQPQQGPYYSFRCTTCGDIIPIHTDSNNPIESKLKGITTDLLYLQQTLADIRNKMKWLSLHYNIATRTLDSNKKVSTFE